MNKWRCSPRAQRDLQRIRRNTQEEYSECLIPTRASDFRLIPEVICVPPSFFIFYISGIPYTKNRVYPCFGIEQEKLLWAH